MRIAGRILSGQYQDSVWLMRAGESLRSRRGIEAVGVVMGTPANIADLRGVGLAFDGLEAATSNDIVIAVRGVDTAVAEALDAAPEAILAPGGRSERASFGSLGAAARALPKATLAVISVNGAHAADEARDALGLGLDVMVFSDNVEVADEVAIKDEAAQRGLLVMGPDCGTAVLSGVGLGFANELPRGAVGLIAASGTGAQVVSTELARAGVGLSHLVGLGGRDLGDEVGGRSLWAALAALNEDEDTRMIVLVAKKAGREVLARLAGVLPALSKPVVVCVLAGGPLVALEAAGAAVATSLHDGAERARALLEGRSDPVEKLDAELLSGWRQVVPTGRALQGLFVGGTLAQEALSVTVSLLGPVASNLAGGATESVHQILDLGADEYTISRPHPMINPASQAEAIEAVLAEEGTGALLFDVVLGHGGHADPASIIAPALKRGLSRRADSVLVAGSVCGTELDPQRRSAQVARLREAGAVIFNRNSQAAAAAALVVAGVTDNPIAAPATLSRFSPNVINVGSSWFADALSAQGVRVAHVAWRPPAEGSENLRDLLRDLG